MLVRGTDGDDIKGQMRRHDGRSFLIHTCQMSKFVWCHVRSLLAGQPRVKTFQEHAGAMARSRKSHDSTQTQSAAGREAPALYIALTISETDRPGGPPIKEWPVLLPLSEMAPNQFSLN